MILVKHLDTSFFSDAHLINNDDDLIAFARKHLENKHYQSVAHLLLGGTTTQILNDSYRLTNHIDESWFENPDVTYLLDKKTGCRSTSIGDIICVHHLTYVVARCGFVELVFDSSL